MPDLPSPFVCLVEGDDDFHAVRHLLLQHGIAGLDVIDKKGCDRLLDDFSIRLRGSEVKAVGAVLDADREMQSRWDRIRHILTRLGYQEVPPQADPAGLVLRPEGKPAAGVWLMPDNRTDGKLEDFADTLIPVGDGLRAYARECVDHIKRPLRRFRDNDIQKAYLHTWLAWQQEPGQRIGGAIIRKYLDSQAASAIAFIHWIKRLLGAGTDDSHRDLAGPIE